MENRRTVRTIPRGKSIASSAIHTLLWLLHQRRVLRLRMNVGVVMMGKNLIVIIDCAHSMICSSLSLLFIGGLSISGRLGSVTQCS